MAGDWIKMRVDLVRDPAVIGVSSALGIDEDTVLGKLHRLWTWADEQTKDGNAPGITFDWIDKFLSSKGFAQALSNQGWLTQKDGGICIPKFSRHNGKSAKKRALTAKRVAKHKVTLKRKKGNAVSVSDALPREEKNREEKSIKENTPQPPLKKFIKPTVQEVGDYCRERKNSIDAETFWNHYESNGWVIGKSPMKNWKAAVVTWEKKDNKSQVPFKQRPMTDEEMTTYNSEHSDPRASKGE